jgi:hypothetical protein
MCLRQFGMGEAGGVFNVGVLVVQTGSSSHSHCDSDSVEPMTFSMCQKTSARAHPFDFFSFASVT